MGKSNHSWSFFRAGGVDQVTLRDGADLAHLHELDQKLWVALACPTKGTEIDERTLALIDTDSDGRVRAPEVLAAIEWCGRVLKSLDLLFEKGAALPLAQIDAGTDDGKAVLASARRILKDRGKKDAKEIVLEDVVDMEKAFASTRLNGDGIVPADTAEDEATTSAIADILATVGEEKDRSGKPGVSQKLVDTFFEQAEAFVAWDGEGSTDAVRTLGEATAAAADALTAVEAKIQDYFVRCRVAAFDSRGATMMNAVDGDLGALSGKVLSAADESLARLPLARIEAGKALPFGAGTNPAWTGPMATFQKAAVAPICGEDRRELTEADLSAIIDRLAPYRAWLGKKPAGVVEKLGAARLRALVTGEARAAIGALIEQDRALEPEYAKITQVEKALRLRRDLLVLLRNFVTFADFYGKKGAAFQAGTLYLDARSCDLCIYVNDPAKHAALAGLSKAYLAYCDITRATGEKAAIVAAFTAGDVDNLMVGRNGLFYDRKGHDWDATITSIIENPLSVRQAFWSPYKRLIRLIEEQVAKRAADKEKASTGKIDAAAVKAGSAADQPAAAPAAPAPAAAPAAASKVDVGTVAAIGVAVAGVATFLSSIVAIFFGLGMWMPVGFLALLLAISGPSMLIAWLKLRQRNLGPILDANGWAINARTKINVPFGRSLTKIAALPAGATRAAGDPYAEKPTPWKLYLFLALVLVAGVLWLTGKVDRFLPERARAATVLHGTAAFPAASPPASTAGSAAPSATAAPAR